MDDLIFGKTWDEIQAMLAGTYRPKLIARREVSKPRATESDLEMLRKHGVDWLIEHNMFGILDRLKTSDLLGE